MRFSERKPLYRGQSYITTMHVCIDCLARRIHGCGRERSSAGQIVQAFLEKS